MYINIMRYRTGKFGVTATEQTKQGKFINKEAEILNMKREFGAECIEYRVDTREGVVHSWTFSFMNDICRALVKLPFPSIDNDDAE